MADEMKERSKLFYPFGDRFYNPIHPQTDYQKLSEIGDRLVLLHSKQLGPTIRVVNRGEITAGYIIGVFLLLILLSGCAMINTPAHKWTKADTLRQSAITGLSIIDMFQTLEIAEHPDKYRELNPILGEHPSKKQVILFAGSGIVGKAILARLLPHPYREVMQYVTIGVEVFNDTRNYSIGIRF